MRRQSPLPKPERISTTRKKTACPFQFNPARRAVISPDQLGACLFTGTDKIRSGFGNGDCLLIDPQHLVLAVADATERFPAASRGLLTRLAVRLQGSLAPDDAGQWLELVNALYAQQDYNHKTTLSAVAMKRESAGTKLFIIHGGDSLILLVNNLTGEIEYQSAPDMKFAGRHPLLLHVGELPLLHPDYTVILASDGVHDLARLAGQTLAGFIAHQLQAPLHHLPETVAALLASLSPSAAYDDLALLAFSPLLTPAAFPALLLGGTTPNEEAAFQSSFRAGFLEDEWRAL
jgi:hypothetical protein